ncbi:MAG: ribonuclease III [bacterium]|nr:ribonuclease III [bacterium]
MNFRDLEETIGVTFLNQDLLKHAFIHRSYLNEAKSARSSNERLEFLGDAILSFLTSRFLYAAYPDFPEGKLTNIRSSLVNTKSLFGVAQELNLGAYLFLSHGEEESGGRGNQSLLADAFEALLGAIYLDQGIDAAHSFLNTVLYPKAKQIVESGVFNDFKSLLQEIIQERTRISPVYRVVRSAGPDHAKTFWVEVTAGETVLGEGSGRSKQEAEQQAASSALEKLPKP